MVLITRTSFNEDDWCRRRKKKQKEMSLMIRRWYRLTMCQVVHVIKLRNAHVQMLMRSIPNGLDTTSQRIKGLIRWAGLANCARCRWLSLLSRYYMKRLSPEQSNYVYRKMEALRMSRVLPAVLLLVWFAGLVRKVWLHGQFPARLVGISSSQYRDSS